MFFLISPIIEAVPAFPLNGGGGRAKQAFLQRLSFVKNLICLWLCLMQFILMETPAYAFSFFHLVP